MHRVVLMLALTLTLVGVSSAQYTYPYSENFDSYNPGGLCSDPLSCAANVGGVNPTQPGLPSPGGWDPWYQTFGVGAEGTVSTAFARSGANSLMIANGSDCVQAFSENDLAGHPQSGIWKLSLWQYLPSATFTDDQLVIVNNVYTHAGVGTSWVVQLRMNATTGMVVDDIQASNPVAVVTDQWVEVEFIIDLDGDFIICNYNNQEVFRGSYAGGGVLAIANLDLYHPGLVSEAYYDDLSLQETAVGEYDTNDALAHFDMDGVSGGAFAPFSVLKATGEDVTFNLSGDGVWNVGVTLNESPVPLGGGGFPFPGGAFNLNPFTVVPLFGTVANPQFVSPFPGGIIANFPVGIHFSAQVFTLTPLAPNGIAASSPGEFTAVPCQSTITSENFDAATAGTSTANPGVYPAGWSNGGGTYPWIVDANGTTSGSTGPSGDHTSGTGFYLYCETSSPAAVGNTYIVEAPLVASANTSATLEFYYHMYGASTGSLAIEQQDVLGNWTPVWSLAGNQGNAWYRALVPVTVNTAGDFKFRFVGTCGTSFTGDIAIDDYRLCF